MLYNIQRIYIMHRLSIPILIYFIAAANCFALTKDEYSSLLDSSQSFKESEKLLNAYFKEIKESLSESDKKDFIAKQNIWLKTRDTRAIEISKKFSIAVGDAYSCLNEHRINAIQYQYKKINKLIDQTNEIICEKYTHRLPPISNQNNFKSDHVILNGHELFINGQENDNDIVKAIFDNNKKNIFSADVNEKYIDFAFIEFVKKFTINGVDYVLIRGNCGGTECQDEVYSFGYFENDKFLVTNPFSATKINKIEENNNSVTIDYVEGVKFKKVAIFKDRNVKLIDAGQVEITDNDFSNLYDFYKENCKEDGLGCKGADDAPMCYVRPFNYFQQLGMNMTNFEKICFNSCKTKKLFPFDLFKKNMESKNISLEQTEVKREILGKDISFQKNFPESLKQKILATQIATTFMGNVYGPILSTIKLVNALNGRVSFEISDNLIIMRQDYKDPMTNRIISSAWGFYDLIDKKGYLLLARVIIDGEEIPGNQLVNLLSQFSG